MKFLENTSNMNILFVHFLPFFAKNFHIGGDFKKNSVFSGNSQIGADNEIFGKYFKNGHFICPFFAFFWQKKSV